jgi:hypothetical protein
MSRKPKVPVIIHAKCFYIANVFVEQNLSELPVVDVGLKSRAPRPPSGSYHISRMTTCQRPPPALPQRLPPGKPHRRTQSLAAKKRALNEAWLRRLMYENSELKRLLGEMRQQIAAVDAQNLVLSKEISFFNEIIGARDRAAPNCSDV